MRLKKILKKLGATFSEVFLRKYPWQIHFFGETITYVPFKKVLGFLLKNDLQQGSYIDQYEKKFKNTIDPNGFAFSFGAGRIALYAILEAWGIGAGDEVILPAFTCEVVGYCLLYRGIKPVYSDIEPHTFNLDVTKLESKITKKTKAVIAQHTFGLACNIKKILELSKKHNFYVIEDCALSLGSQQEDHRLGSLGHASFFSTDWTKIASTQWGGMAFTKDPLFAQKLEKIYSYSPFLKKSQVVSIALHVLLSYILLNPYFYPLGKYFLIVGFKFKILFQYKDDKEKFQLPVNPPYLCRLSNFQSYIGLLQLEFLEENLALRKKTVDNYVFILEKNGIRIPTISRQFTLRFPLLLKERASFKKKWGKYFEVGQWFDSPLAGRYEQLEKCGYEIGSCPVAEKVHQHIVNFPTHQRFQKIQKVMGKIVNSLVKKDVLLPEEI